MKKGSWNIILFYWLLNDVFKYPLNKRLNLPFKILKIILCPVETTYYLMRDSVDCFDLSSGVFTIYGMRYSHEFFRALSNRGLALNSIFQILKRKDGVITIKDTTSDYIKISHIPHTKEEAKLLDNKLNAILLCENCIPKRGLELHLAQELTIGFIGKHKCQICGCVIDCDKETYSYIKIQDPFKN